MHKGYFHVNIFVLFFSDSQMPKLKSKCHFKDEWLEREKFKCWVKKVPNDHHKAYCTYCMTEISFGGLGVTALDIHAKGQKYFLKCRENENEKQMNDPNKENSKVQTQTTIDSLLIKDNTVKAEIRWALESLMSNYSYNSCSSKSELCSAMFSDSDIAEKFSMGKTKCAYYVTHGIAPYFKRKFIESLQLLPFHSVSFDESYNDVIK